MFSFLLLSVPCSLAAAETPRIEFSVKPRLCVLAEGEEFCEDELQIRWRTDQENSLCLYRSDQENPLRCWYKQKQGRHTADITVSEDIEFYLQKEGDETPLSKEAFEVVQDNTQYRRRRRNAWSFF